MGPTAYKPSWDREAGIAEGMREDFIPVLTDEKSWGSVLKWTDVFKSYINILPERPIAGESKPRLSDESLLKLIAFLNKHGIRAAFEVGGLRLSDKRHGTQAGEDQAKAEAGLLRRWVNLGGNLDYISTDHAVMKAVSQMHRDGADSKELSRENAMTLGSLNAELVDYFAAIKQEFPSVRLGVIESLGFFHVRSEDGYEYKRTDQRLPIVWFEAWVDDLLQRMAERGLELDHFHIDYGVRGAEYDARQRQRKEWDFGRMLAVERVLQKRGIRTGLIINPSRPEFKQRADNEDEMEQQAHELSVRLFREYLHAGGNGEDWVFQTWHDYPLVTGPADRSPSFLATVKQLLDVGSQAKSRH